VLADLNAANDPADPHVTKLVDRTIQVRASSLSNLSCCTAMVDARIQLSSMFVAAANIEQVTNNVLSDAH
jgi:hypothetical protein